MNIAVILAGGIGQRMGQNVPKQFIEIYDIPIIIRTIQAFENHKEVDSIVIVCLEEWVDKLSSLIDKFKISKIKHMVKPGNTRRESSYNAIYSLEDICSDDDIILIHDAARPNISESIISANIEQANKLGACETVIPAYDTIIISNDGTYSHEVLPREKLFIVQTPQSFKYSLIKEAHQNYLKKLELGDNVPNITDDAGLLLYANKKVSIVKGDKLNIKVTSPEDILLLKAIINHYKSQ